MSKETIKLITQDLSRQLIEYMADSDAIYILTSFVMKSGVAVLADALRAAANRGVDIKICTGDYLFISQPDALEQLYHLHPNLEIRLWQNDGKSFHPKAYLFEREQDGIMIIGSSNLSRSALTKGIEWNLQVHKSTATDAFSKAIDEFLKIHLHEYTVPVNLETIQNYRKRYEAFHLRNPELNSIRTQEEEIEMMLPEARGYSETMIENEGNYQISISPRFAQIPALDQLEITVEEGYEKAMVIMATGLGKTYLAAFFARKFKRILFIAHLEEILNQAETSFKQVMERSTGIFNGKQKVADAEIIFASVQTLSRKRHLETFSEKDFDLIIIDEFHHAAAKTYTRILEYFKPKFLLGITATPDRKDNRDIYAICDGNVAYKIDFIEAISQGWLCPFHYYGVYDDTDYSQIRWLGTRYDAEELAQVQLKKDLALKILEAWKKHKKTQTLVFCSSIRQATFLSNFFNQEGYCTMALHSQTRDISRSEVISQLKNGELDAIFTVDLFNEGIDIPTVDTLLFVRPTESLTIFTQQIGRGLRLHPRKDFCVVIDLIANYRNADIKLQTLGVDSAALKTNNQIMQLPNIPNCIVEFELQAKQLLEELMKKRMPRKEKLLESYQLVKMDLGHRPTYLELHKMGTEDSKAYKQEYKSYVGFLAAYGELNEEESQLFLKYQPWVEEIEKTLMNRSYKMVVLKAMLNRGPHLWKTPITPQEVAPFFHHYLTAKDYRKRIDNLPKNMNIYDETRVSKLIADMPMSKWASSSKGLFSFREGSFSFSFECSDDDLILFEWIKDICEYRLASYFERKSN